MRLWYVRRGVSWTPLLACCGLALAAALLGRQWSGSASVLQSIALACCTAAAAFLFDEASVPVVSVTPRGGWWRRSTRLALVAVPLVAWIGVLVLAGKGTHRPSWALAGSACIVTAAGVAALCARRQLASPGSQVASAMSGLVLVPLVIGPMAGWKPVLPLDAFPGWLVAFWCGVAAVGVTLGVLAVRPGIRP